MNKPLVLALLLAATATAAADPVKMGGHEVDFTRPAKWKTDEKVAAKDVWKGQYTLDDGKWQIVVTVAPHKLEDGPLDLVKLMASLDEQNSHADLKPANDVTSVEADGFAAKSHHYSSTTKNKHFGMTAIVDGGTFAITVTTIGDAKPDDLTKAALDLLASIKVDGKKGPAVYPAKKK